MSAVTDLPAGLSEYKRRELASGGVIEFEVAPAGSLTIAGEPRLRDYRAYYWTPQPACVSCEGSGRVPSDKRPGGTVQCKACKGSGQTKRERMVSVTTLLDVILPKPGLYPWNEARGIEGADQAWRLGEITPQTHPADVVRIVRDLKLGADAAKKTAADRGLNVHALLEAYMLTGNVPRLADHPVEHHGYIQSLCGWLLRVNPEPEAVEDLVCDPAAGYAGRRDLVARAGGFRVGYDAKTQENAGIYTGAHLQLRMYDRAAVACGEEPCDFLTVVVFPADGGDAREMSCEATDATIKAALAFYREVRPIDLRCSSLNSAAKRERVAEEAA